MILYGKQVCLYALEHHSEKIKTVYVAKKGILPNDLFHKYHDNIKFLEEKWAQSMSKGGNHQGLLVEMDEFEQSSIYEIKKNDFTRNARKRDSSRILFVSIRACRKEKLSSRIATN